ncbi:MAG: dihydroneopterin aldolase [Elusimicrobia bacterium]|nr:dihydroneopterin aldolase [Elusimicrobiota bacterium]
MDILRINGISLKCRIGADEAERRKPQRVRLDLALETDLLKAGLTDDLRDGVDYQALEGRIRAAAESGKFKLLERFAEDMAEIILAFDRRIRAVGVRASKSPAAMPKILDVVVDIRRERPAA